METSPGVWLARLTPHPPPLIEKIHFLFHWCEKPYYGGTGTKRSPALDTGGALRCLCHKVCLIKEFGSCPIVVQDVVVSWHLVPVNVRPCRAGF